LRRLLDAEPALVRATYKGAAATMLEAIAQPDVFSVELGVDPRIIELLIERGRALKTPLNLAACFNLRRARARAVAGRWFDSNEC
jgi:hypothetical protein